MRRHVFRSLTALIFAQPLISCGEDGGKTALSPESTAPSADSGKAFDDRLAKYPNGTQNGQLDDHTQLDNQAYVWMDRIHLHKALESVKDHVRSEPIIAVLDSGVDYEHPALQERIVDTSAFATKCRDQHHGCNTADYKFGQDDLGNGASYPLGTRGPGEICDGASFDADAHCMHGTHVAGIIAGYLPPTRKGDTGIFGVCPSCRILPVKIVNDSGEITDDAIYAAFEYIAELLRAGLPIRIVNASFGKYRGRSPACSCGRQREQLAEFLSCGASQRDFGRQREQQ
jgi:subtilisin family serine protease